MRPRTVMMQVFSPLAGVAAGLGVAAGAHHGDAERNQAHRASEARSRVLKHDADLREASRAKRKRVARVPDRSVGDAAGTRPRTDAAAAGVTVNCAFQQAAQQMIEMRGERDASCASRARPKSAPMPMRRKPAA